MKIISMFYVFLVVFCKVSPVNAVLIKSEIDGKKQTLIVHFSQKILRGDEIEEICGDKFTKEDFSHDGVYRQITKKQFTKILTDIESTNNDETRNVREVFFYFENISLGTHIDLLKDLIKRFEIILYNIAEDISPRLRSIGFELSYKNNFDEYLKKLKHIEEIRLQCPVGHEFYRYPFNTTEWRDLKGKKKFDEAMKSFNSQKNELKRKQKERLEIMEHNHREFIKNNYPKANIYKGEPSDSSDLE